MGTQYRTGVYYTDDKDLEVINQVFDEVAKKYDQPLAVEKETLKNFVVAEDYHQDYLKEKSKWLLPYQCQSGSLSRHWCQQIS